MKIRAAAAAGFLRAVRVAVKRVAGERERARERAESSSARRSANDFPVAIVAVLFAAVAFTLLMAMAARADEAPVIGKTIKGCTAVVGANRSVFYEKALVVAEKPAIDESGNADPEWWVFYPDDLKRHEVRVDGVTKLKALNLPKSKFIEDRTAVTRAGATLVCPAFFWSNSSGYSAANR
jgi:hypothetical protein